MEHTLTRAQAEITEEVRKLTLIASVTYPEVGSFYASIAECCGEMLRGEIDEEEMPAEAFPIWECIDRWPEIQERFRVAFNVAIASFAVELSGLVDTMKGDV